MAIFRKKKNKENPYAMISKNAIGDSRLSWKAKGILSYLLSMPDDWTIYLTELEKNAPDGKTSTASGIKELIFFGYIRREQKRSGNGTFGDWEYNIHEEPEIDNPRADNLIAVDLLREDQKSEENQLVESTLPHLVMPITPKAENPLSDNQPLLSTDNTNILNTEGVCAKCASPASIPSSSEKIKKTKQPPAKKEIRDTFRADKLVLNLRYKSIAVSNDMHETWMASEFKEFCEYWADLPNTEKARKTEIGWQSTWRNWVRRIQSRVEKPRPHTDELDECIPSECRWDDFINVAKNPRLNYADAVEARGGFDYCYIHGFPFFEEGHLDEK